MDIGIIRSSPRDDLTYEDYRLIVGDREDVGKKIWQNALEKKNTKLYKRGGIATCVFERCYGRIYAWHFILRYISRARVSVVHFRT